MQDLKKSSSFKAPGGRRVNGELFALSVYPAHNNPPNTPNPALCAILVKNLRLSLMLGFLVSLTAFPFIYSIMLLLS
jgi:hypothetical protein